MPVVPRTVDVAGRQGRFSQCDEGIGGSEGVRIDVGRRDLLRGNRFGGIGAIAAHPLERGDQ